MPQTTIHADVVVQQELASRGIDAKTGVFGDHKVQLGKGLPISLDKIKTPSLPYAGFKTATKISRGREGIDREADNLLRELTAPGNKLDAGRILSAVKAGQAHLERLDKLGQLTQAKKDDTMWMFTKAVEKLSNKDLAAVYQSFTSAEMDLLQTALQREGEINPDARDARMAASRLFDLQALVLKEVSNRSAVGIINDLKANNPDDPTLQDLPEPKSLSATWGNVDREKGAEEPLNVALDVQSWHEVLNGNAPLPNDVSMAGRDHDMSGANLLTLVEVSAQSATIREKTALDQAQRMEKRDIQGVSVKEMADVMRQSELTYNLNPENLVKFIIAKPDEPISNIFHLAEKGIKPKGDAYLEHRDAVEKQIFPELEGHEARGDERPVYGALNVGKDPIGAATMGYGDASIVFKPSVAKRSTFIADDTFYSPRLSITPERKALFYSMLDGAHLPQSLVDALKDPDSQEHKDMEAWLDRRSARPNASIHDLEDPPSSIYMHFKELNHSLLFNALMPQCFIDKEATRNNVATYDNLESLVVNMSDINGNALANAALKNRQGGEGRVALAGIQYIEAQIHGPVIPSRDIAEIRVNVASLPGKTDAERAESRRKLEAFGQKNGVKITLLEYDPGKVGASMEALNAELASFNAAHVDTQKLNALTQDYLDNFEKHVQDMVAQNKDYAALPQGMLRLEGAALIKAKETFARILPASVDELKGSNDLDSIFTKVMFESVKSLNLGARASCLQEIAAGKLAFAGEAQKQAFITWVCSSTSLPNVDTIRAVHAQATGQAALFREIANANPPMTPQEILTRMSAVTSSTRAIITEANTSDITVRHVNENDIANNAAYVTRLMLQSGEPPLNAVGLLQVFEALNAKDVQALAGQLKMVGSNPEIAKAGDAARLMDIASGLTLGAKQLAAYLNRAYDEPDALKNISMLPQAARDAVKALAPEAGAKMDEICPAYAPFPQPARPEGMPTTETQRRDFLVKTLDTYMAKEKTGGDFTHGRGHITRAYIFANVMCTILEEEAGETVDRNAVLLGITGHDLGRERQGEDLWEEQSAQLTTQAMNSEFGDDAVGQDYATSVGNCIQRGKTETVEAMLLKSADSLDIGRTVEFDTKYFPFLGDKDPNKEPREADKYTVSSPKVSQLREQLAKEAKILEIITDPNTRFRDGKFHLMDQFYAGTEQQNAIVRQQYTDLVDDIKMEYQDQWAVDSETFVTNIEDIVLKNPDLFPVLSKYYRKD